jgi:Tfp pilus assembly protein PilP
MAMRSALPVIVALLAVAVPAAAQAPARTPAAKAAPNAAPPAQTRPELPPLEPQGYTYDAGGRRDPFVSLIRRGVDARSGASTVRPSGLAGLSVNELALKGIVMSGTGYVAMAKGADNKTYLLHVGDKLFDGTVRAIDADSMVILQQVTDPLSTQKQREVRKLLRQTEEAK